MERRADAQPEPPQPATPPEPSQDPAQGFETPSVHPCPRADPPRELRFGEINAALAFAKQHGGAHPTGRLEHALSLAFHGQDPDALAAVMLTYAEDDHSRTLVVYAPGLEQDPPAPPDADQLRAAIDHLMLKLAALRVARVRIVAPGAARMPDWLAEAAAWADEAEAARLDPRPRQPPTDEKAHDAPPKAA
ncbi:MAG: hypothetical protein AAGA57_02785 [Planctomycetota bacterium]